MSPQTNDTDLPTSLPPLAVGVGIEDTFVVEPVPGRRELDEYVLTDHDRRWREDVELLVASGADQIRWGVPWYRVHPAPHRFDFSWTDEVLEALGASSVEVILDLVHYGTPAWLEGSFADPGYPTALADLATAMVERYPQVTVVTPTNEPSVTAERCGEDGIWPPHLQGDAGYLQVLLGVARGVVTAQRAVAAVRPDITFWHVEASRRFVVPDHEPPAGARWGARAAHLRERVFLHQDLVTGRVDDAHPLAAHLRAHGVDDQDLAWFAEHAVRPDVLGVNYYPHVSTVDVGHDPLVLPADGPRPSSWPVTYAGADALEDLLRTWHARYPAVPLALTETGDPGTISRRVDWVHTSMDVVQRLRAEGLPLVGWTWWALIDFLLWDYREGSAPAPEYLLRHGLWDLVPDGTRPDGLPSYARVRTAAADAFVDVAARYGRAAAGAGTAGDRR
ncbi:family 1 glycosylhydrolase [Isoptericola sp. NPDC057191]|uniref:family 1 glycosylhydrolase n=1 Tax=Isoptericola sp. NPDC057191 TaxID=3346041 RepID=UPI00362F90DF